MAMNMREAWITLLDAIAIGSFLFTIFVIYVGGIWQ